jgi:CRP-like cAMP-binding protein
MANDEAGAAVRKPQILVVEDNYLAAKAVCDLVEECGYAVAGSVARLDSGLDFIARQELDGALVDINLDGTMSFPLCAELRRRRVPFTFLTGYSASIIPAAFRDAPLLLKPIDRDRVKSVLADIFPVARPVSNAAKRNRLLQSLAEEDRRLLEPVLECVPLAAGDVLQHAGEPVGHIVFPDSGAVSIAVSALRERLEVALVGREGLVGHGALLDAGVSSSHAVVRFAGSGWRIASSELRSRVRLSPLLHRRLLRHLDVLLAEVGETAMANGRASIEQRVARWLLTASDRLETNALPLTHDLLAAALGVRRAGITVALHQLEGRHAIRSRRGRLEILSRSRLIEEAGGFYADGRSDRRGL